MLFVPYLLEEASGRVEKIEVKFGKPRLAGRQGTVGKCRLFGLENLE